MFENDKVDEFGRIAQIPFFSYEQCLERVSLDSDTESTILNSIGNCGLTLPFVAYCGHSVKVLEGLLERGADPDAVLTADIFDLVQNSDTQVYDPAFSPRKGDTILLSASLDPFQKSTMIPLVLKYTKTHDARDLLKRNALHRFLYHRVQKDQKFLLAMLIDAGIKVDAMSVSGNTPCHIAAYRNGYLIPELVSAGADIYVENSRGETPLDLLKQSVEEKWIFHEENQAVLDQLKSQGHINE